MTEPGKEFNANRLYDPQGRLVGHLREAAPRAVRRVRAVARLAVVHQRAAADPARLHARAPASAIETVAGHRIGSVICFESAFGPLMRANAAAGAEAIVVTTNNRSYRRSSNAAQHVALSQMSAAAIGRPVLHASISGITAVIDADGVGAPHDRPVPQHGRDRPRARRRPARRRTCAGATGWSGGARVAVVAALAWALVRRRRMSAAAGRTGSDGGRGVSDNEKPIEKAVELLVYAPIGLAMFAKDTVPTFLKMFVARGHTEVTQRRKSAGTPGRQLQDDRADGGEVRRTRGQAPGRRRGRERAPARRGDARRHRGGDRATGRAQAPAGRPAPAPASPPAAATPAEALVAGPGRTGDGRPAANGTAAGSDGTAELPIPDYDLLSATQVIERLEGLAAAGAARDQDLRAGAPGPHHDPGQDRAARAVTR